eukprot:COSAG04_NODE_214_length_20089_cov_206.678189_10_plen_90_part_00
MRSGQDYLEHRLRLVAWLLRRRDRAERVAPHLGRRGLVVEEDHEGQLVERVGREGSVGGVELADERRRGARRRHPLAVDPWLAPLVHIL